jgi:hypothetical protein
MLESFNAHVLTNTPKGVIRIHKSKKDKQELAKRKRHKQYNGQTKKEQKENSRYYITQNTEDGAKLSCSQSVGYSCFSRGIRRITNVDNLVISHIR